MSEIHEAIEKAQEGEHGEGFNKRIALVIAILALFLSFSETLGKGAQTEAISKNVESSDLWAFFQAKNIRITQVTTAAEEMTVAATGATDPAVKAAMEKQIEAWKATAERLKSEPKTGRERARRTGQGGRGRARSGHGEISPLRIVFGRVPGRHRARLGGGDHRHGRARLVRRRAWRDRACAAGARAVCAACGAVHRDVVDVIHVGVITGLDPVIQRHSKEDGWPGQARP